MSIAWCFEVISQKSVRHELDRAPIRMVVVARLLEYLDFEDDLLGASARIEVVGRAPDSSLAVEFVAKLKPDMVLVSIGTCLFHGLKVIRILRHRFRKWLLQMSRMWTSDLCGLLAPTPRAVILSTNSDCRKIFNASRRGDLQAATHTAVATKFLPPHIVHFHFPRNTQKQKEKS